MGLGGRALSAAGTAVPTPPPGRPPSSCRLPQARGPNQGKSSAAARCSDGMLQAAGPPEGWAARGRGAGGASRALAAEVQRDPTRDDWEGDSRPPAPGTHLGGRCRWRRRDGSLVGKGTWGLSPGTVSTWVEYLQGRLGGKWGAAALALCRAARPGVLGPFYAGSRGATCVPGLPRSPRPAPQRGRPGPRPAAPAPRGRR